MNYPPLPPSQGQAQTTHLSVHVPPRRRRRWAALSSIIQELGDYIHRDKEITHRERERPPESMAELLRTLALSVQQIHEGVQTVTRTNIERECAREESPPFPDEERKWRARGAS